MTIQQRIFETMEKKHISQMDLSNYTGIATSTISSWKTKGSSPSSEKLSAIAECLGVTIGYILGVEEQTNINSPTISMCGNSYAQGYVNHTVTNDVFSNPEVTAAYNSLSPTQKLEIQIEILKKADSNGEK